MNKTEFDIRVALATIGMMASPNIERFANALLIVSETYGPDFAIDRIKENWHPPQPNV